MKSNREWLKIITTSMHKFEETGLTPKFLVVDRRVYTELKNSTDLIVSLPKDHPNFDTIHKDNTNDMILGMGIWLDDLKDKYAAYVLDCDCVYMEKKQ